MKEQVNEKVYKYFKEISSVPRQSGNEEGIKNYLVNFAKLHNLKYFTDKFNNVIIYKNTCDKQSVILHAHTDMVCVKNNNKIFDFKNDAIEILEENGYLTANGTTLGADNGIGMAIILSILDSELPVNVEALFTSEEETTMLGAQKVDITKLNSKNLICLDGFQENAILTSTASFADFLVNFNKQKKLLPKNEQLNFFKVSVNGLLGGHSGSDINKFRLNGHKITARLLQDIKDFYLLDFYGGKNFNVITDNSFSIFATSLTEKNIKKIAKNIKTQTIFKLKNAIKSIKIKNKHIFSEKEARQFFFVDNKNEKTKLIKEINHQIKTLKISIELTEPQKDYLVFGKHFVNFISLFNQGVLAKNKYLQVETSQNISEVCASKGYINIGLRSSVKNGEKPYIKRLMDLAIQNDMAGKVIGSQPAFNTMPKSKLCSDFKALNKNSFESSLHIGVELGVLQERIKNLDAIIISPTILDAHSTKERVEILSINSTYSWLVEYLKSY